MQEVSCFEASDCMFIDDRIENIQSAIDVGIQAYHLDRKSGKTLKDFKNNLNVKKS